MAPIQSDIVSRMTALAGSGASPAEILRDLSGRLPEAPARSLALMKYMRAAFGLTLEQASPVAGWAGGELTDARLDELLAPDIGDARGRSW